MEILQLLIENSDSIISQFGALLALIVGVLTIVNKLMPTVITNSTLAKVEAITSTFSIGTKKAEIIDKK